ncbi:MAG: HNH endonuclease, partial [Paraglaciecola chathamensis]
GQGQFRKSLLSYWGKCAVTGASDPALLLASHIKPWSKSNDIERLDRFNGLLLTPNLDRAFDQGLISFDPSGEILISSELKEPEKLGINESMKIYLETEHHNYMGFHRKNLFKST